MDESGNDSKGSNLLLVVSLLVGFGLIGLGVLEMQREGGSYIVLGLGLLSIVLTTNLYGFSRGGSSADAGPEVDVQRQTKLLQMIAERMLLSDQAKRIAYRQKDRDALREAIINDMKIEDYDAAMALVNDMADVYGYREEAEQFRQQILTAQQQQRQRAVDKATAEIDAIIEKQDWDRARTEVARMIRTYPDYPEVQKLGTRVDQAYESYKNNLVRAFREAYEKQDFDRASELLTEMDRYLTPHEAEPFMQMAREVLNRKREYLGVQYKMAAQDQDFIRALTVAEQIVREFPNTQFATEMRNIMDKLRERAAQQRATMTA